MNWTMIKRQAARPKKSFRACPPQLHLPSQFFSDPDLFTMSLKSPVIMCILLPLLHLIAADTLPTRPSPFGSCSGIASYQCPASSGCCFAGSCCGSGCCAATEMCVYPNTPQAGCCRFDDPTLCGSKITSVRWIQKHSFVNYWLKDAHVGSWFC
jgi:hypothetical protein